jgi:prefoldin subunit 5
MAEQPIIKVYDPEKEVKEAISTLQRQQKIINRAIEAVVVVVAVGFITIIIAAFDIFKDHEDYAEQKYNEYIELLEKRENELKEVIGSNQKKLNNDASLEMKKQK